MSIRTLGFSLGCVFSGLACEALEPEPAPCAETDTCLQNRAPCEEDEECASGQCEPDPDTLDGKVCLTLDCAVDDDCDTAAGEFCIRFGSCGSRCSLPITEDEQCGLFPNDEACAYGPVACAEGLACVEEGDIYFCRRLGSVGTPCDASAPACDAGLSCDATLNVCQ